MRNLLILFLISTFHIYAENSFSQNTRLTLNMNNTSVEKILNTIEKQSEFYFLCNKELVDVNRKISINLEDRTITEILSEVFQGTNVDYMVLDRQIVLSPVKYLENIKRAIQKTQQERIIKGTVTDPEGQPLVGVTVMVAETNIGVITGLDGTYSINLPEGAEKLLFSFVGLKTLEVPVAGKTIIDIKMELDSINLEEVVAVGYGVQKKINLTGAVTSLSYRDIQDRPVTSLAQAMQGLVPNLQISTTDGGRPGSPLSWQIRGPGSIGGANDSPLILIDGVADVGGTVDNLNPEDIESISILKDASASAIYGSRAPYGVVLITTKKGKSEQMNVTVNSSLSWRSGTRMLNPVGSMDFMNYYNESHANLGLNPRFDQAWIDSVQYRIDHPELNLTNRTIHENDPRRWHRHVAVDTDWWSETYKSAALTQNYNVSASGGTQKITYYTSLGYMGQEGLYRHGDDSYNRYTGLMNLNVEAMKWLDLRYKLQLSRSIHDTPNTSHLQYAAFREWPIKGIRDFNGNYSPPAYPLHIANDGGRRNTNKDNFSNTIAFIVKPFKNFHINGDVTLNSYDQRYVGNQKILYTYNPLGEILGTQTDASNNFISKQYSMNKYYAGNLYADYTKQLGSHYFYLLAGTQLEYNHFFLLNGYRDNLLNEYILSLNAAIGENLTITDNETEWSNKGYFARFNYNYEEKYLIEFNGRYDGSSKFPQDYRWGFFPSVSLGYNISKELWFEPMTLVFDMMKLRASYGSLGNSNVGLYYSTTMSKLITDWIGSDGTTFLEYISSPDLGNYYLTWEKPTTLNLALDLAMFDNRLQTSFDWYQRKTVDMIGPSRPLPKILGVTVPKSNNTEMKGTGWEWSLSYRGVAKDFKYQAALNVSYHREVVTRYYNPEGLFGTYYEGKVLGEIWGFETLGIINDAETLNTMADQTEISSHTWGLGDIQYKDQNDDGKITRGSRTLNDPGDLIRIGNTTPSYEYNIILDCNFKGFDLRMFFRGLGATDWWPSAGQGDVNGYTHQVFFGTSNNYFNHAVLQDHLDHWTPENTDAYYPRVLVYNTNAITQKNNQVQTRYLQNRAFIRLKNVQLGYTLPSSWTKKYLIQNARFYVSGENLLTFTKLRIFDPETPGLIYPLQKVFSANIKFSF